MGYCYTSLGGGVASFESFRSPELDVVIPKIAVILDLNVSVSLHC